MDRTRRTAALLEIAVMSAVLLSYIWGWEGAFTGAWLLVIALYFGVGLMSHLVRREWPVELGFRVDNLSRALVSVAAVVVPATLVLLATGFALQSWHFPPWVRIVEGAPLMLAWGTAQQYGLLCFFYRRFLEIFGGPWAATVGASVTFAAFHAPNGFLVAVTLAAGAAACTLYRREPNVFVIGMAHALVSFFILCALPFSLTHGLRVGPGYWAFH